MSKSDYETRSGQWVKENKNWTLEKVNNFLNFISKYKFEIFDNRHLTKEQDSFIFKIKK